MHQDISILVFDLYHIFRHFNGVFGRFFSFFFLGGDFSRCHGPYIGPGGIPRPDDRLGDQLQSTRGGVTMDATRHELIFFR